MLIVAFSFINAQSQTSIYRGIIGEKMYVTFFIETVSNNCGVPPYYQSMYKYDGKKDWIQLEATANKNNQFVFAEYAFSGVLILEKKGKNLQGICMSPDRKTQFSVELKEIQSNEKEIERLKTTYEELNYQNYDC